MQGGKKTERKRGDSRGGSEMTVQAQSFHHVLFVFASSSFVLLLLLFFPSQLGQAFRRCTLNK